MIEKCCANCIHFDYNGSDYCTVIDGEANPDSYCMDYKEAMFCYKCRHFDGCEVCRKHNIIVEGEDFCEEGQV